MTLSEQQIETIVTALEIRVRELEFRLERKTRTKMDPRLREWLERDLADAIDTLDTIKNQKD